MTKEELLNMMQQPDTDTAFLNELQESLESELKKNAEERNYDLIADLSKLISEIRGTEDAVLAHSEAGISWMKKHIAEQQASRRKRIWMRCLTAAAACAVVLFVTNMFTLSAFGMNVFSATVRFTDGGLFINFGDDSEANTETEQYAAEILAVCEENGFMPLVPHDIPAGMTSTDVWGEATDLDTVVILDFDFAQNKKKLNLHYTYLIDPSADWDFGFPFEPGHLEEETICGVKTYFARKSDTEFQMIFQKDQVVYDIYADGLDEIAFRKIIYSMFN